MKRSLCNNRSGVWIDPGRPLDKADLFLARQLLMPLQNITTDRMMLPPKVRRKRNTVEEPSLGKLEVIGEQTVRKLHKKKQIAVAFRRYNYN